MQRKLASLLLLISLIAGVSYGLIKIHAGPRAAGPLPSGFYIWQRRWDDAVREAIQTVPPPVETLAPLCSEITWNHEGRPSVATIQLDESALKNSGRPVSAVLRVGQRPLTPDVVETITHAASQTVSRMRAHGIDPVELQIDFDSSQSQLHEYRALLAQLRTAVAPTPVYPTALPSWLSSPEFEPLARQSGGFILQVHATRKPQIDAPETALCEASEARRWVEQAAALGVPFRVALPTYAYRVAFSPSGDVLAIEAEQAARRWPPGVVVRLFRPNPVEIAGLIKGWTRDRPASLQGLLWYRLPVSSDTQNWKWPTLSAVMQGRAPRDDLRVEQIGSSPTDLVLVNHGDADAPLPERVIASTTGGIDDADGVGGYHAEVTSGQAVFKRSPGTIASVPPGGRHALGWLRAGKNIRVLIE